jgi:hypothetical protein
LAQNDTEIDDELFSNMLAQISSAFDEPDMEHDNLLAEVAGYLSNLDDGAIDQI